jgi:hypothetical protein
VGYGCEWVWSWHVDSIEYQRLHFGLCVADLLYEEVGSLSG